MSQTISKEHISLGLVDATHIRVLGLIRAMPSYAYPLERSLPLEAKEIFTNLQSHDYQESPIWDWAGELLVGA